MIKREQRTRGGGRGWPRSSYAYCRNFSTQPLLTPSPSPPCISACERARARAFVSLEKVVILSRRKNPVYPAPFLPQSKLSASPHHPPSPSRSSSVPLRPLRSKVLTRFASSPPDVVRFLKSSFGSSSYSILIEYTLRIYFPRFREGSQGGWGM